MTFQKMRHTFSVLLLAVSFFFCGVSSSLAANTYNNYQSNQGLNQSATLTAPSSDSPIKVYPQPDFRKSPLAKAQKGDLVTVMQHIEGNQGKQWDYVKFEQEDQKEGWIQRDYVAIQTQQSSQKDQKPAQQSQSDRLLRATSTKPAVTVGQSASAYSQQEDYPDSQQSKKYQNKQQQSYSQTKQDYQKSQSSQRNQ